MCPPYTSVRARARLFEDAALRGASAWPAPGLPGGPPRGSRWPFPRPRCARPRAWTSCHSHSVPSRCHCLSLAFFLGPLLANPPETARGKGSVGPWPSALPGPPSATLDSAFLREHQATRHFHHQPPPRGFTPMCRDPRRRPHSCRRPTASPLPGEGTAQSLSATLLPSSGVRFTARAPRPLGSLLEFLAKLFLI